MSSAFTRVSMPCFALVSKATSMRGFYSSLVPTTVVSRCSKRRLFIRSPGRHSQNEIYGTDADHSALMPANPITLAHFSVSSARSLPNSAGEPETTVPPMSASRTLILGSARAAGAPFRP